MTKKRIRMIKIEMTNQETTMKRIMTMMKTRNHMIKMIMNQNIHHLENMIETMTKIVTVSV
jgi:hypothetical protein